MTQIWPISHDSRRFCTHLWRLLGFDDDTRADSSATPSTHFTPHSVGITTKMISSRHFTTNACWHNTHQNYKKKRRYVRRKQHSSSSLRSIAKYLLVLSLTHQVQNVGFGRFSSLVATDFVMERPWGLPFTNAFTHCFVTRREKARRISTAIDPKVLFMPSSYFVSNCDTRHGSSIIKLEMATSSKDLKKQTKSSVNNDNSDLASTSGPTKARKKVAKRKKGEKNVTGKRKTTSTKGRKKKAATKAKQAKKLQKQRDPSSVVVRLSKAAKEKADAVAAAKKKPRGRPKKDATENRGNNNNNSHDDIYGGSNDYSESDGEERLGSVLDLAHAIEEELELLQLAGPIMQGRPTAVEPTFSLSNSRLNMMQHNEDQEVRQAREKLRNDRNRIHQILVQQQLQSQLSNDEADGNDQRGDADLDSSERKSESSLMSSEVFPKPLPSLPSTCHVAVVFPKPLLNGQITVEYASRLEALARTLSQTDSNGSRYKPLLICLLSSDTSFTGNPDHKASAVIDDGTAGYIYFQHLCEINNIPLNDVEVCIVPMNVEGAAVAENQDQYSSYDSEELMTATSTTNMDHDADGSGKKARDSMLNVPTLQSVAQEIQENFLDAWLDQSQVYESKTDEYGMTRRQPRKKVHIHVTLFSTDYQLCNLNDIHTRSPRQSPFQSLQSNSLSSSSRSGSNARLSSSATRRRVIVDTTWSFHYSAYPFREVHDNDVESFLGSCYLLAQDLQPLLVNLRGVVDNVSHSTQNCNRNRRIQASLCKMAILPRYVVARFNNRHLH